MKSIIFSDSASRRAWQVWASCGLCALFVVASDLTQGPDRRPPASPLQAETRLFIMRNCWSHCVHLWTSGMSVSGWPTCRIYSWAGSCAPCLDSPRTAHPRDGLSRCMIVPQTDTLLRLPMPKLIHSQPRRPYRHRAGAGGRYGHLGPRIVTRRPAADGEHTQHTSCRPSG